LVRQRTSLANRIHAELHQRRLALPREALLRKRARGWLKAVAWPCLGVEQRHLVTTHLKLIDVLTPMVRALDKRIERVARNDAAVAVLETIPGIGPYRGLLLAAELSPITRFAAPEQLVSYAGLAPVTRR
jgi:transposase